MKEYRSIEALINPPPTHWVGDGFHVHNFIPGHFPQIGMQRLSPYILLDYGAKTYFEPSEHQRGVGVHPHKGFETVTVVYQGKAQHHDSAGNSGIIGEGEIQWMTAGSGILHKEYHEKEFSKKGGIFHVAQIWVNLPAKYKLTPPKYQAITKEMRGIINLPDNSGNAYVIAGELMGVKGPASTFSPVTMVDIHLKANSTFEFELPDTFNAALLILEGDVIANDNSQTSENKLIVFNNDGKKIKIESKTDSKLLLMSGEPINEPIAAYGPFVMNTKEEIQQAYMDFQSGKFGHLED